MSAPPPIGIFNQMWASTGVSDRAAIKTAIEDIRHAEAEDFASMWIGEHHVAPGPPGGYHGRVPASEVFLAYLAAITSRISLGTGIKILATNSALRSVEEMCMLNLLAPGRIEFGLGLGQTYAGATETREEKASRYRALLIAILDYLNFGREAGGPMMSLSPCPELVDKIWVAARDAPTLALAAQRGLHLVVGQAEPSAQQARHVRRYRAEGGKGEARGARLVFVAETRALAEAEAAEATEIYFSAMSYRGYHAQAIAEGLLPPTAPTPRERRRQVDFFVGAPDDVAELLNAHVEEIGIDRLDVMAQVPGLTPDATRRSLTLIHREVRPRLRLPARANAPLCLQSI